MIKIIRIPTKCIAFHSIVLDVYVKKYIDDIDPNDFYYFHSCCDFMCYSEYCDECSIQARETAIFNNL